MNLFLFILIISSFFSLDLTLPKSKLLIETQISFSIRGRFLSNRPKEIGTTSKQGVLKGYRSYSQTRRETTPTFYWNYLVSLARVSPSASFFSTWNVRRPMNVNCIVDHWLSSCARLGLTRYYCLGLLPHLFGAKVYEDSSRSTKHEANRKAFHLEIDLCIDRLSRTNSPTPTQLKQHPRWVHGMRRCWWWWWSEKTVIYLFVRKVGETWRVLLLLSL